VAVTVPEPVLWTGVGLLVVGWLVGILAWRSRQAAKRELRSTRSRKRSQSVRYGQLTERFAPWMDAWPFDPEGFRPLGTPVDGVQFTDEAVYLVEIKAADSQLSADQRELRELVREGRVGWLTFRVGDERPVEIDEPRA
jgi:predicted Holliday junction resolvase-like endonuclease